MSIVSEPEENADQVNDRPKQVERGGRTIITMRSGPNHTLRPRLDALGNRLVLDPPKRVARRNLIPVPLDEPVFVFDFKGTGECAEQVEAERVHGFGYGEDGGVALGDVGGPDSGFVEFAGSPFAWNVQKVVSVRKENSRQLKRESCNGFSNVPKERPIPVETSRQFPAPPLQERRFDFRVCGQTVCNSSRERGVS